ncbi:MAG: DUF5615 family PIN-like protein [bacterium]|nr:DUF5615 family PIN-like protein [bacterium]
MKRPKLLLDENISIRVAKALRQEGYNVFSIGEEAAGLNDSAVLAIARKEKRIVITLDKDFGALVYQSL